MRFANIGDRAHVERDGRYLDLHAYSSGRLPADPMAYLDPDWQDSARKEVSTASAVDYVVVAEAHVGPPVPRPPKILAVALNYREHAAEAQLSVPDDPVVFGKFGNSLVGPYDDIEVPDGATMVDYEAELVVVIGARASRIAPENGWSHIAGITAGQDISDRYEQRRPPLKQFSMAKSYDSFSPTGPVLATLDEFADLDDITVRTRISGEVLQDGSTALLIHPVPQLVSWISQRVTLEPGDLIFTGTPAGVGSRREPPLYLKPGMVVETTVGHLSPMRNPVIAT